MKPVISVVVGVAQPITGYGEIGHTDRSRDVVQSRMLAPMIVSVDPCVELRSGVIELEEQAFIEQLVAHPTVESFAKAILH